MKNKTSQREEKKKKNAIVAQNVYQSFRFPERQKQFEAGLYYNRLPR